jgi:hypothetical protein
MQQNKINFQSSKKALKNSYYKIQMKYKNTKFKTTNKKALNFFIKMRENRFHNFEKWLIKDFLKE